MLSGEKGLKDFLSNVGMHQSTTLKLSYQIGYLMLAKRALRRSQSLGKGRKDISTIEHNDSAASSAILEAMVIDSAILVLQTFSQMADYQAQGLPVFYSLSIAYSTLIISHYNHPSGEAEGLLGLLTRVKVLSTRARISSGMHFAIDKAMVNIGVISQGRGYQPPQSRLAKSPHPNDSGTASESFNIVPNPSHLQNRASSSSRVDEEDGDNANDNAESATYQLKKHDNMDPGLVEHYFRDVTGPFEDFFSGGYLELKD